MYNKLVFLLAHVKRVPFFNPVVFFIFGVSSSLTTMNQLVLSEEVVNIQDKENYFIPNEVEIEGKSDHDLARYLNGT